MSLAAGMIGLATLAVNPVWTRHGGCRVGRMQKHGHEHQWPQRFRGEFVRAGRTADL